MGAAFSFLAIGCDDPKRSGAPAPPVAASPQAPTTNPALIARIEPMVRPPAGLQRKDGIALAILLDTSGSMSGSVKDADGRNRPKIDIARRCVAGVVRQAEGFAREQPDRPLRLAIYEFSGRASVQPCRQVAPMGPASVASAEAALQRLKPDGNTPIGDAIIQAKRDLDAAALSRMHILIVTDGENTSGYTPGDAVAAIARLPLEDQPGIYFIAFDVAAAAFGAAKEAGALVLPAADAAELQQAMDELVGNKILLEK